MTGVDVSKVEDMYGNPPQADEILKLSNLRGWALDSEP